MNTFHIYKHLPISIQNLLVSYNGLKLSRLRFGEEFEPILNEARKSERWSAAEIVKYKTEQINRILHYAYQHVPFYRNLYDSYGVSPDDFRQLSDMTKFPIVTKEDVRQNMDSMISDEIDIKDLVLYHTSGSTGTPLGFYWSKHDIQFYMAMVWRGRERYGIHLGDSHLSFTGKLVCPLEQNKPPYWRFNKASNKYMLNMQHITKEKTPSIVDFINSSDIKFFVGYPSSIYTLALFVNELGLVVKNPPHFIFCSSEKMYDYQKEEIYKAFKNVVIAEHYGFSEQAACASQCHCGVYHEDFEFGHLEIENTELCEGGLLGTVLATGFQNLAMPLIRYRVGDSAVFSNVKCSCGLNSQVLLSVEGRIEDYVVTPEGAHIKRWTHILKESPNVKECQLVQDAVDHLILRIVKRELFTEKDEQQLVNRVKDIISPNMNVSFEYVSQIERTKAGKFKAMISKL